MPDRPHPRRSFERLGDVCRHADLLPDAARRCCWRPAIMLAALLFVFGASGGAMDVAMNAHGVAVERVLVRSASSCCTAAGVSAGSSRRVCGRMPLVPTRGWRACRVALVTGAAVDHEAAGERLELVWRRGAACRPRAPCPDHGLCLLAMRRRARSATGADLPPSRRRGERGGGGDGIHRLLPRDGRRASRRRLPQ